MGKSGRFVGHVHSLRANERQIRMTGTFDDTCRTGTGAKLSLGAPVTAYLEGDIKVALTAGTTPAFMQVPMTVTPK